ncbi:TraB/GumN family protein [Acidimangrovimonas sediminis]|uniref:TraB/GumN family protein n=1 Tax=Acidimangrovimonas sediminis TaxID=2056283 RepID=UPI000C7F8C71|nr:TraB/GumN family protein [Acidimangrovimonas sediminis]
MTTGRWLRRATAAGGALALAAWLGALAPVDAETAASPPAPAATCSGHDLIAGITAAQKARLVGDAPYPTGNLWQATRGDEQVTLVGTYHLDDPRFAPMRARIAPLLERASALLVEASAEDQQKLSREIAADPSRMFITSGPTLPDQLPEPLWQQLSAAMKARGIPTILAAKFQPWYVAMILSIPPCAMASLRDAQKATGGGLDRQLIRIAEAEGVPVRSLEPWNTTFKIFDTLGTGDQIAMIRSALAMDDPSGDMFVTTANAYFRGQHQLIWALGRARSLDQPGEDPAALKADFAQVQSVMLDDRNRAWLPVIETAAANGPVVAAFGAAHLGGRDGVLALLHGAGWTLTRLDP